MKSTRLLKTMLVSAALTLAAAAGFAEETVNGVVVSTVNGTPIYIQLVTKPHVEIDGNEIVISSDELDLRIPLSEHARFAFADLSGVNEMDESRAMIKCVDGTLSLSGFIPGSTVKIYSIGGQLMAMAETDSGGSCRISAQDWQKGVYIIQTKEITSKLIIK